MTITNVQKKCSILIIIPYSKSLRSLSMADAEIKFKRGKLFAAAWRGEFEGVKAIIDCGDININATDENGVTALRFTAQFSHLEISK